MRNIKGFTLVELVIVIVIIGILTVVAISIYKENTKKAIETEANTLLGSIQIAEKIYYAEHFEFFEGNFAAPNNGYSSDLDIDARSNKYFKGFSITKEAGTDESGAGFKAVIEGGAKGAAKGIKKTLEYYLNNEHSLTNEDVK